MPRHRTRGLQPLTASQYQSPDDLARQAAEAADSSLAGDIDDGWDSLSDALDVAAIAAALAAGGYLAVRALITTDRISSVMAPVLGDLVALQNQVGAAEMAGIDASAAAALSSPAPAAAFPLTAEPEAPLAFDAIDPVLVATQQQAQATIVQNLATTVEATVDQAIRQGISAGNSVDEIAAAIKQVIGLTPRQAAAVQNFRTLLETGDSAALDRALRDRRFDATIQRLIDGQTVDPAKVDAMVARYAERMQAYRAQVIARTETLRAANGGKRAAWAQFADRKRLDRSDVIRFWQTAGDEAVCLVCSSIPLMNPDGTSMDEPYDTPEGPVMMPPDPHPLCRCTERFGIRTGAQQRPAVPYSQVRIAA